MSVRVSQHPKSRTQHPIDPASAHRWFKRALALARLPATMKMHELRHRAVDHL